MTTAVINFNVTEIANQGQIARMNLPYGWSEQVQSTQPNIGTRSTRTCTPAGEPEVRLTFFYRGLPVSKESASTFQAIIRKRPHHLSPSELKALTEILRERSDASAFTILAARTEDMNGKRVLMLQGRYTETLQDLLEVLIDTDGTGRAVQEVFFQAPKDKFIRHIGEVKAALRSIEWKQSLEDLLNI